MKVEGTNCGNCLWIDSKKEPVTPKELNENGGLTPTGDDLKAAKEYDLITLAGKAIAASKQHCTHPDIDQMVTKRMCCALWDANGCIRAWEKK